MNKMQGEVNKNGSGNGVIQQTRVQMSPVCSAFSKNWLPTIFEAECSPRQQLGHQKVDYLQSRYQSRLIQQQSLTQSNFSGDSHLLTLKERELLWKVYQKEKELVILQDKMFMLRNSNECLRETIEEMGRERVGLEVEINRAEQKVQRLLGEVAKVREGNQLLQVQNRQLRQKIDELNQQVFQLNQKLLLCQQSNQLHYPSQQQPLQPPPQFLTQYQPLPSATPSSLLHTNTLLANQIQSLKQFYQQQFYTIINKHQISIHQLQQNLTKALIQKQQFNEKCTLLEKQIQKLSNQKKQILEYYLGVIDQMKSQIQVYKVLGHNYPTDKLLFQQRSFDITPDYIDNTYLSHQAHSFDRSIHITQILNLQKENQLLMHLLGKTLGKSVIQKNFNPSVLQSRVNGSRKNSKSIKKSGSSSSLSVTQNLFQQTVTSIKPSSSIIPHSKYTQRLVPCSSYCISPTKPTRDIFSKKGGMNSLPPTRTANPGRSSRPKSIYQQKQSQIDLKLEQIKNKLTRQLTLT